MVDVPWHNYGSEKYMWHLVFLLPCVSWGSEIAAITTEPKHLSSCCFYKLLKVLFKHLLLSVHNTNYMAPAIHWMNCLNSYVRYLYQNIVVWGLGCRWRGEGLQRLTFYNELLLSSMEWVLLQFSDSLWISVSLFFSFWFLQQTFPGCLLTHLPLNIFVKFISREFYNCKQFIIATLNFQLPKIPHPHSIWMILLYIYD